MLALPGPSRARLQDEADGLLDVVGLGLDVVDVGGGHGAEVGHAGGVGGEQDEEVAGAGELVAPLEGAGLQAVEPVFLPLVQEGGGLLVAAR